MQEEVKWPKAFSGDILPKDNPVAIEVMREVGIDISKQRSMILTEDLQYTIFGHIFLGSIPIFLCVGAAATADAEIRQTEMKVKVKVVPVAVVVGARNHDSSFLPLLL